MRELDKTSEKVSLYDAC